MSAVVLCMARAWQEVACPMRAMHQHNTERSCWTLHRLAKRRPGSLRSATRCRIPSRQASTASGTCPASRPSSPRSLRAMQRPRLLLPTKSRIFWQAGSRANSVGPPGVGPGDEPARRVRGGGRQVREQQAGGVGCWRGVACRCVRAPRAARV